MAYTKRKVKHDIQKNILDNEHQRYLTYFNISVVFVVTSAFTAILSFLTEKITFGFFTYLISFLVAIGVLAGFIFKNRMNSKLDEIRKL